MQRLKIIYQERSPKNLFKYFKLHKMIKHQYLCDEVIAILRSKIKILSGYYKRRQKIRNLKASILGNKREYIFCLNKAEKKKKLENK